MVEVLSSVLLEFVRFLNGTVRLITVPGRRKEASPSGPYVFHNCPSKLDKIAFLPFFTIKATIAYLNLNPFIHKSWKHNGYLQGEEIGGWGRRSGSLHFFYWVSLCTIWKFSLPVLLYPKIFKITYILKTTGCVCVRQGWQMKVGRYTVKFISDPDPCSGQLCVLTHLAVANVCAYLQKSADMVPCLSTQAST